eukprot:COSAG03_NODE_8689_length_779_cov_1.580882_2_plen_86_part_01
MRPQVYWIVFAGLNVFEQFGLLPVIIGNVLYASARPSLLSQSRSPVVSVCVCVCVCVCLSLSLSLSLSLCCSLSLWCCPCVPMSSK